MISTTGRYGPTISRDVTSPGDGTGVCMLYKSRWVRAVAWLGLWSFALAAARPAAAEDAMSLTLIDLSDEEAATREIAFDVSRAVKKSKAVRFADLDAALNLGGEEVQVTSGKTADQLAKSGLTKLKAGQFEDAVEDLDNAVGNYLIAYVVLPETSVYARTMALFGAAQFMAGDLKGAEKTFEKAVQADQKVPLDISEFSPKAQALLDKARQNVSRRDQIDFEIRTDPPNARAYVNGRFMGLTPVFASSTKGEQLITLTKQGSARKARKIAVEKTGVVLEERLEPARRAAALDGLRPGLMQVLGGTGKTDVLQEAEGVVAVPFALLLRATGTREKMKIELALASLNSRQLLNQVTREVRWESRDKETREQIDKMVDEVLKPRVIVAPDAPKEVQAKPIYKRWWFWTIVAAVAGGSAAAYFLAPGSTATTPDHAPGTGGILIQF